MLDEVALGVGGDARRARSALEEFGLGWAVDRHPRDLSSGERERLGLAATAVSDPDLLVLDEPTRGVDPGPEGGDRRVAPRPGGRRNGDRRRDARPDAPGAPAGPARGGGARCRLDRDLAGDHGVRRRGASAASLWAAVDPARGGLAVLLAALALLAGGFAWLEGGTTSARDLTLVATLGGLAAAGRVLFAPIPDVQPVTVMVAAAGVALGPRRGFAVGAIAALASNFFLGQGVHTPWQMLAWGGCGVLGGLLRPLLRRRLAFAAFCVVLGFAFGTTMDTWEWFTFYPHTWAALTTILGQGGGVQHRARDGQPGARARCRA